MNLFKFLFSPAAQVLGQTLLYNLLQSFIIFLCVWIILKMIPKVASRIKYALCCFGYVAIAGSFIITFIYKLAVLPPVTIGEIVNQHDLQQILLQKAVSPVFSFSYLNNYLPFFAGCYLAGIIWFAFRLCYNYLQTNQLKRKGLSPLPAQLQQQFSVLLKKINVPQRVLIYFSSKVSGPMMIGFIKPVILLPFSIVNHLTPQQFEAVLLHELAHVRRLDFLWNLIQSVADTILFFNPFAIWISKTIREEREKCCDEIVLQWSDPYHYANALLALRRPLQKKPLVLGSVGKHAQLLHRIKNIIEMKHNRIHFSQKLLAFLVILIAAFSVAWLIPKGEKPFTSKNKIYSSHYLFHGLFNSTFLRMRSLADSNPQKPEPLPGKFPNSSKADISLKTAQLPPSPPMPPVSPNVPAPPAPPLPPLPTVPPMNVKDSVPGDNGYFNSKEWKDQQEAIRKSTDAITKYLESKEWKDQQELINKNSVSMKKYFNSPEWKKQQAEIQRIALQAQIYFKSAEWKKNQAEIKKSANSIQEYLNSPEWKKQQDLIQHSTDSVVAFFNSKNWKQQQENLKDAMDQTKKYFESDQWKKQQEKLKSMLEQNKEEMKMLQSKGNQPKDQQQNK